MKSFIFIIPSAVLLTVSIFGHGSADNPPGDEVRKIVFPDTTSYQTLVFDPHTHSVFSDGHVWPRIRVGEAFRDGLDALAITEHLEYQPHIADIPHPDRNRAYEDAVQAASHSDLIIVPGAEITRDMPASHMNALFILDANELYWVPKSAEPYNSRVFTDTALQWPPQNAVKAANEQGAFVFWNHAWWTKDFPNGIPSVSDFHLNNIRDGLLHGIEIANGEDYSEEAFQIALDNGLTLIGSSDVHNLVDWDYQPHKGGHRPVTLVLASERTTDSMKEAMFGRRTVVWFKNLLIGRAQHLNPLLEACLSLHDASYTPKDILTVSITNKSDADFQLRNLSPFGFHDQGDLITVAQHSTQRFMVKTGLRIESIVLEFEVLNAYTAPRKTATLVLQSQIR